MSLSKFLSAPPPGIHPLLAILSIFQKNRIKSYELARVNPRSMSLRGLGFFEIHDVRC